MLHIGLGRILDLQRTLVTVQSRYQLNAFVWSQLAPSSLQELRQGESYPYFPCRNLSAYSRSQVIVEQRLKEPRSLNSLSFGIGTTLLSILGQFSFSEEISVFCLFIKLSVTNFQENIFSYQELTTFGFPSLYEESKGKETKRELNIVAVLNCMNELLVLQRKNLLAQENVETQNLKLGSDMDHLQNCYAKLKVEITFQYVFQCHCYIV